MTRALCFGAAAVALALPSLITSDAHACGGCFHPEDQPIEESSVVLAHRMALSLSTDASVLWDQVQYTGSPSDFAWVLPVKPGARLEVASDAWFEVLDAATAVRTRAPTIQCVTRTQEEGFFRSGGRNMGCQVAPGSAGCNSTDVGAPVYVEGREVTEITDVAPPQEPVSVVHQGSAGPYETVTLHANVQGALVTWLTENGYAIAPEIQPIIDAYSEEGFDFIALRLLPDIGVQQMKPVRVIQPGTVTTLPLRMVAAGTGATVSLSLFVIAEGRYEATGFANVVRPDILTWDFDAQGSSYATQRTDLLAGKATFMTSYAQMGALLSEVPDPQSGGTVQYTTGLGSARTIADAFMDQALANGESDISCAGIYDELAMSKEKVVDPCPAEGGPCAELGPDQIDARYFDCGPIKDLKVALTGIHPADVWLTRLEAELPRWALSTDLGVAPAIQHPVENLLIASDHVNPPCELASSPPSGHGRRGGVEPRDTLLAGGLLIGLAALLRRLRRARVSAAIDAAE